MTEICPDAVELKINVIELAEMDVKEVTAVAPMLTDVAAPTFVPVTVTRLPTVAEAGVNVSVPGMTRVIVTENEGVTNGVPVAALIVNVELRALPSNGIFTSNCVLESTANGTETDPVVNLTEVVPARFVPVIINAVPAPPVVTLNGLRAKVGTTAVAE